MNVTTSKNCRCRTCHKDFHYLGIARHRARHRDKGEDCEIIYSNGECFVYEYSKQPKKEAQGNETPRPLP